MRSFTRLETILLFQLFFITKLKCLKSLNYPQVWRNNSAIDDYHGVKISDPYRWLENLDSEGTISFVHQQNNLSAKYFSEIPYLNDIKSVITALVNYPRSSALIKKGTNHYFHFYNSGLQSHDILMMQQGLSGTLTPLLDPNNFSDDGSVSLYPYYYGFTSDASHFVYALSHKGSDWLEGRIRNVETAQDLGETLEFIKWPEFSFMKNGTGLFYSRFPLSEDGTPKTTNPMIYYHVLGTSQSEDIYVVDNAEHPEWFLFAEVSYCGNYLILKPQPDFASNSILIAPLSQNFPENSKLEFTTAFSAIEDSARFIYVTNTENIFVFVSDKDAPNFRLVSIDIDVENSKISQVNVLVNEHPTNILKWARPINENLVVLCYFEDVKHKLVVHSLMTGDVIQEIQLPFLGVISDFHISRENDEFFFKIENLVNPGVIMRCQILLPDKMVFDCIVHKSITLQGVDPSQFEMIQEFYTSKDGTRVPMYVAKKTNLRLNGENPTLLFGYGGFNVDLLPTFSPFNFAFIDIFDGIYAQPNIRGGAEYGEYWHEMGSVLNKQNSFDDFQSGAEHLILKNYTSSDKLSIHGSSNGGLLVATCVNQRPDLFAVALPDVGLLDMLRFQKSSIGFAWCSEYGCSENERHFYNLVKYSPLHNIDFPADGKYPAILVSTGDHDDRVIPSHSYKYIAELQHTIGSNIKQTNALILRVTQNAGHSGDATPLPQLIQDYSTSFAFVAKTLNWNNTEKNQCNGGNMKHFDVLMLPIFVILWNKI